MYTFHNNFLKDENVPKIDFLLKKILQYDFSIKEMFFQKEIKKFENLDE